MRRFYAILAVLVLVVAAPAVRVQRPAHQLGRTTAARRTTPGTSRSTRSTRANLAAARRGVVVPEPRHDLVRLQPDRRRQRRLRARPQQLARRHRRDHRQGNLDPREPARHRPARDQLLGEQGPLGSPAAVPDEQLPAGDRRPDRQVDHDVRHRRRREPPRRAAARPGHAGEGAVVESGQGVREPDHPRVGRRRALHGAARRHPRLRRRHRAPGVAVPHRAAPGRVRLRDVAEGRLEIRRRREQLGRALDRRRARHRLHPDRLADLRLLRRRPSSARISSGPRCSRSTRAPASGSGTSRWCTTTSGTTTTPPRRSWRRSPTTASRGTSSRRPGRPATSTCSTASPASRSGRSRSGRFPASDMPGEKAWPTQPIPTAPPPFARQSLTVADINPYILTTRQRTEWEKRIGSARNEGLFTPPSFRDTVSIPGAQGGANWGTTAADPARGLVYVLGINVPSIYKLSAEAPRPGGLRPVGPAEIAAGRAHLRAALSDVPRRQPDGRRQLSVAGRRDRPDGRRRPCARRSPAAAPACRRATI